MVQRTDLRARTSDGQQNREQDEAVEDADGDEHEQDNEKIPGEEEELAQS
jgi:hypothetical protein